VEEMADISPEMGIDIGLVEILAGQNQTESMRRGRLPRSYKGSLAIDTVKNTPGFKFRQSPVDSKGCCLEVRGKFILARQSGAGLHIAIFYPLQQSLLYLIALSDNSLECAYGSHNNLYTTYLLP